MLDVAWPELIVIGAVALVVIGPKDLPKIMRVMGRWTGKAQRALRHWRDHLEQLGYEAEVAERLERTKKKADPPDSGGAP